jgi:hypothetical protein
MSASLRIRGARGATGASVSVSARPLWQIRLARGLPRYVLYAACVAGLVASARFTLAPPRVSASTVAAPDVAAADPAAEGYAVLFARRYLSWNASQPQLAAQALTPMIGTALAPGGGLTLPPSGEQHVLWAEVVQVRGREAGAHVYTVATQTDATGLVYLAVGVAREPDGSLALAGYPAFVGPPDATGADVPTRATEVDEPALAAVVGRALRNYLAGASEDLAADLSSSARVSAPGFALTLESVQRLGWSGDRRSVLATVLARDARGVRYTLGYEVDVADFSGRWEVSAIEMEPQR